MNLKVLSTRRVVLVDSLGEHDARVTNKYMRYMFRYQVVKPYTLMNIKGNYDGHHAHHAS